MTAAGTQPAPGGPGFRDAGRLAYDPVPRQQADAARLADQVTAARPELRPRRAAVERMLRGLIEACTELDVLGAYTTVLDVPGGLLPATLVVSVRSMGSQTLDDIARDMTGGDDDVIAPTSVRMFDLPAGRTVRVERFRQWPGSPPDRRLASMVVQYVTEIPRYRRSSAADLRHPGARPGRPAPPGIPPDRLHPELRRAGPAIVTRLTLTVRTSQQDSDLLVTASPGTPVGELLPGQAAAGRLFVNGREVTGGTSLAGAGVRDGAIVSTRPVAPAVPTAEPGSLALLVAAGRAAGASCAIPAGGLTVGRSCAVCSGRRRGVGAAFQPQPGRRGNDHRRRGVDERHRRGG